MPSDMRPTLEDVPVVVVGASGFVGAHLCAELNRMGLRPLAAVRSTSQFKRYHALEVDAHRHTIDTTAGFEALFGAPPRVVVNCATAYSRSGDTKASSAVRDNLLLPLQILDATPQHCAFIQLDTFSAVDPAIHSALPEYHLSKRQFRQWLALEEKRTVAQVRLEHVYGPHDAETKFVSFLLRAFQENLPEIALTEGIVRRDFVHVHDVVAALGRLIQGILSGRVHGHRTLELGTGESTRVRDFVSLAKELSGATTALHFGQRAPSGPELPESKAHLEGWDDIGWKPRIALADGIRATLRDEVTA